MVPPRAYLALVALASTVAADQRLRGPFKGPYGPPRHQRQYLGDRQDTPPFPFSTGALPRPISSSSASSSTAAAAEVSADSSSIPLSRPATTTARRRPPPPGAETAPVTSFTFAPAPTALPHSSDNVSFVYSPGVTPPHHRPSGRPRPRPPLNESCQGETVNIADASLDWWYTETYTQIDSTFLVEFNSNDSATGWTLISASSTFNVTSAIADPTCTSTTAFNAEVGETMLQFSCWDTPTPVAAATTTVEQTAYKPINATTAKGSIPSVVVSPTPAALTIDNSTKSISSGAPIVYFSKYEVVSKRPSRHRDGKLECIETTRIHNLTQPISFEYKGRDHVNGTSAADEGITADIHFALLKAVGQATATPGSFVASPTVVVVVQKIVAAQAPLIGGIEQPAASLDVPTATLPSGLSIAQSTPTDTGTIWVPLSARVESSESALQVPTRAKASDEHRVTTKVKLVTTLFKAHQESKDITLAIPVNPASSQSVVTAVFEGNTVTATILPPNKGGNNQAGGIWSAIVSAVRPVKPTNALDVLTNAAKTFTHDDSTASAIAEVIGAIPQQAQGQHLGSGAVGGSQGQQPVLNVGSSRVTASWTGGQTAPALVVGGQTVSAGGPAITVDGTRISVVPGAGAIIIGDKTSSLPGPTQNFGAPVNIPLITIGSQVFTANAATQFNIHGSVLTPGGQIVASGTTISLGSKASQVLINGQTQDLSPATITPAPLLRLGDTLYEPNGDSTYFIDGSQLTPGGQIVVSGTTISLPRGGSSVMVNGIAQPLVLGGSGGSNYATITAPPALTIDGKVFAPNGRTAYLVSGQTLTPGGAITYNGPEGLETVSLNAEVNQLVIGINGITGTSVIGAIGAAASGAPVLTINGDTYPAVSYNSGSGATYVVDGQTLTPGGEITITNSDGVDTISLLPGGTAVAIAHSGATSTSHIQGAYGVLPTDAPILTIGGKTFTAINNGATYVIDGDTLTPGGTDTVVIDGKTYIVSLYPHATMLEIQLVGEDGVVTSTIFETLFPATMTGSTVYNTVLATASTATQRQSATTTGATATGTSSAGQSYRNAPRAIELAAAALVGLVSFTLALWL